MVSRPRSLVGQVTDLVVHVAALVPVAPARAFAYFTSPGLLATWLTAAAEVEAEVGGRYELFWNPGDREVDSTIGCRITALVADELVAFQWRGPRPFRDFANGADPLTHVIVAFLPAGAGTRVHLVRSGWRSGPEWEGACAWQERAWSGALRELERVAYDATQFMAVDGDRVVGWADVLPAWAHAVAQEAVKRRAMRFGGVDHDALLMSLLKDAG